ncbi:MAG TPA: ATP-dependent zinc metalloprotease FtsH [Bacilli bacterium]
MNRIIRNTGFYLLIFLVTVGIVQFISNQNGKKEPLNYSQFRQEVQNNNVSEVNVRFDGYTYFINGKYKTAKADGNTFEARAPFSDRLVEFLETTNVKQTWDVMKGDSIWITLLTSIIPFVIIFVLFFFLFNQAQGGGGKVMNFGKSRARLYNEEKKKVTFDDVAGADEEKQELIEVVEFLKDPRKFAAVGARIPKGVLLVGPPGTGKTLLARAVAGEAGVPFFSISGSDFVEMFVGVGASRVRDLFENAKKNAPCIIFIDEIDAVGRQRGAGLGGGHDEREQTLNQLLVEMDGFGVNEGIIIVAATNRPDILDPALLRPGRFDRQITVDRPDVVGREAVLRVHVRNKPLSSDIKLDVIAKRTTGFTGADLENLMNEAALLAARRNRKEITMNEMDDAIDRLIIGTEKKSRIISDKEKKIVAYHEAGHTIVGFHLDFADTIHKVTVIPRGRAGGYAIPIPKEDRSFFTKNELLAKVTGLLGGRVAEEIILGEASTGASNDFVQATNIIRRMITEFGMSEKLGPVKLGNTQGQVFLGRDIGHEQNYSDSIAYEIDKEIHAMMMEQYERCKELLTKYKDQLELVATTLMEVETLDSAQIKQLIENGKLDEKPVSATPSGGTGSAAAGSGAKDDVKVKIQVQDQDNEANKLGFDKDKKADKETEIEKKDQTQDSEGKELNATKEYNDKKEE